MISFLKYLFFLLASSIILLQCASIQTPSGGNKDMIPPQVLRAYPEPYATEVNPRQIKLTFDEYFSLRDFSNELLVSPPLEEKPEFSIKGKNLIINLKENLKQNTTYTFNFGNGIADFHEGNILSNFSMVFSTGEEIDSLSISGDVFSTPEDIDLKGFSVGLYKNKSLSKDSSLYLMKPNYSSLVNDSGRFQLNFIRDGLYELIGFEDLNGNKKFDSGTEKIAFHDQIIEMQDSLEQDIWFYQAEKVLKILEAKDLGRLHWALNKHIDSVQIYSIPRINYFSKIRNDSVFVWPYQMEIDSAYIIAEFENQIDSILVTKDSLIKFPLHIFPPEKGYLKENEKIQLEFCSPILQVDSSKIRVLSDSISIDFDMSHNDFFLRLGFEKEDNKSYLIKLDKGAISGLNGSISDSTEFKFYTKEKSSLSGLKINLITSIKHYFVEIIKEGVVLESLRESEVLIFGELLPTDYEIRLTEDRNKDGKWTPGNYLENCLPEKVYYYKEPIKFRANWELEIDWKIP